MKFDLAEGELIPEGGRQLGAVCLCIPFRFERILDVIGDMQCDANTTTVEVMTLDWCYHCLDQARITDIDALVLRR